MLGECVLWRHEIRQWACCAHDGVDALLMSQNSLQTLATAIDKADWESASRACRRAMTVRQEVIDGGYAGAVVVSILTKLMRCGAL
jgi:hypothetical protein